MQAGLLFSLWSRVEADVVVEEGSAEEGPQVGLFVAFCTWKGTPQQPERGRESKSEGAQGKSPKRLGSCFGIAGQKLGSISMKQ